MIASTSDIVVADLVHQRIAGLPANHHARTTERLVYISALWAALCADSDDRCFPRAPIGQRVAFGPSELADFQAWLTRIVRYTDASGRPLIVLDRVDTRCWATDLMTRWERLMPEGWVSLSARDQWIAALPLRDAMERAASAGLVAVGATRSR